MANEQNLVNGRQKGSKNKKVIPLFELLANGLSKGIMLTGFTISNNKIRMSIATEIGPTAALLYVQLYSHKNRTSGKCFPSIEVLSKETGISERKVSELIGELCEAGYIIVRSGGRHFANTYWFPYEPKFDPNDIEVLMAYRRKNIFSKKKTAPKEALDDIEAESKKFAYSKEVSKALDEMNKSLNKNKKNVDEESFDDLPY